MTTSKARNAVAIPRAFILDCDGVLTDPVVKCVTRLDVFTALGERLDRGEVVTINTGRSIAWLIRNGIIDFVERAVHNKANLERFMVVCEKGASWVTFIGGVIRTNIDKSITVPEAVREDVYDLVQDHFLDCMFWDPTKLTMISVEMIDGMPMEAFQKRQADLVVELEAILDSPEHRPLRAGNRRLDHRHRHPGPARRQAPGRATHRRMAGAPRSRARALRHDRRQPVRHGDGGRAAGRARRRLRLRRRPGAVQPRLRCAAASCRPTPASSSARSNTSKAFRDGGNAGRALQPGVGQLVP